MEVSYKRDLSSNYLILKSDVQLAWDYEVRMITENRISGLLSCMLQENAVQTEYYYEITGTQNMRLMFDRRRIGYETLKNIIRELAHTLDAAKEFLLNPDHILFDPEYMYLDPEMKKVYLCYFPGYEKPAREAFLEWTEYLLSKLEKSDSMGIEFGYDLYQCALEPNFSLMDILQEHSKPKEEAPNPEETFPDPGFLPPVMEEIKEVEKPGHWKHFFKVKGKKEKSELMVAEAEIKNSAQPIFLKKESQQYLTQYLADETKGFYLKSMNPDYPDLQMQSDNFLIGKSGQDVDGGIPNPAISRIHARISKEKGCYYLEDLNSTNGTWIDGEQLNPYELKMLSDKMHIVFANAEYEVHL